MNFAEMLAQFSYKPKDWRHHKPFIVFDAEALSKIAMADSLGGYISLSSHQPLITKQGKGCVEFPAFQVSGSQDAMLPTYQAPEAYTPAYVLPKKICIPDIRSRQVNDVIAAVVKIFPELGLLWYVEKVEKNRFHKEANDIAWDTTMEVRPVAPVKHCAMCDGTGRYADGPFGICPACAGTGDICPGVREQLRNTWSFYLHDHMDIVNSTLGTTNAYTV